MAEIKITPRGLAGYAKDLYEPYVFQGKNANPNAKPKYKGVLRLRKGDASAEAFVQPILKRHSDLEGAPKNAAVRDGDKMFMKDKDGKLTKEARYPGEWVVQFKSAHKPRIVDSKKQRIPAGGPQVFGGDEIRIAYSDNIVEDGSVTGHFLYLNAVQLLKKNSGDFGEAAANAFEAEDGFEVGESYGSDDDGDPGPSAEAGDAGDY